MRNQRKRKKKKGITPLNEEEIVKPLQKKRYDKIRNEKNRILIGSKEQKATYNKKNYEKLKEEKKIKKEKKDTVITSLDEEDIIHYYHNDINDDGR